MLDFFNRVVNYFIQNNIIKEKDKELYLYGLQQGAFILVNIVTTLLIGYAFDMIWQSVVFMVAYLPLRAFAGGYHARTQILCYLYSIGLTIVVLLAIKIIPWTTSSSIILSIIAGIIISILAPVEDINKLLDKIEIKMYKARTRIILSMEFCILLLMLIIGAGQISFCITTSLLALCIMLLLGGVKVHSNYFNRLLLAFHKQFNDSSIKIAQEKKEDYYEI